MSGGPVTATQHGSFDETSLHQDIIKTWGEHGAHNDVFTFMRAEIRALQSVVRQMPWSLPGVHPDWTQREAQAVKRALNGREAQNDG